MAFFLFRGERIGAQRDAMTESYQGNYLTDEDALNVYCGAGTSATVKLSGTTLTLAKDGTPTELDLADDKYNTLTKLVDEINKLDDWNATLLGVSTRASTLLVGMEEADCLGSENAQSLKTVEQDVSNWPVTWEAVQKRRLVEEMEALVEKITHDYFYEKAFVAELDGNSKSRLFLGLKPDIVSVTKVEIYGEALDASLWSWDKKSIFVNPEQAMISQVELKLLLKEEGKLFPHGIKNIRVTGAYGATDCPHDIRRAVAMMIEDVHNPTLHSHWIKGSQSIGGDYSYTNPEKIYTGIIAVDRILKRYIKRKVSLQA